MKPRRFSDKLRGTYQSWEIPCPFGNLIIMAIMADPPPGHRFIVAPPAAFQNTEKLSPFAAQSGSSGSGFS
jgi:hypothetical protein